MLKWLFRTYTEQISCEKRVKNVMTRLKIEEYDFNWDRNSCFIEFIHHGQSYKMEHSIAKAKEKGVFGIKSGLDCLMELVHTLEDLCKIIERGTYALDDWVTGMIIEPANPEQVEEEEEEYDYSNYVSERTPRILRMRN